jgi:hypothetical protein
MILTNHARDMSHNYESPDNRFVYITPDDHSGYIWITSLLSLAYAFCFLGFRFIVKRSAYGIDDVVMVLAYVSYLSRAFFFQLLNDHDFVGLCIWTLGINIFCAGTRLRKRVRLGNRHSVTSSFKSNVNLIE